jgi:hypothetical protein
MLSDLFRDRGLRFWLPSYLKQMLGGLLQAKESANQLTHVMFLICDHYEPRHKITKNGHDVERVKAWVEGYPRFAAECQRLFGHYPLHSWFYPPHHGLDHLVEINKLVFGGFGEIELHYHHDNDTPETLDRDLRQVIKDYNARGILLSSGNEIVPRFSFIHGDWALDNSHPHGYFCGVNNELDILQNLGCWGDFTMPSADMCQTTKINSIYYAIDNPNKPKSHNHGADARVGKTQPTGFFLMQGPLGIRWKINGAPKIENASLTNQNWGNEGRVKYWIKSNIHVKGKPEWKFIKLHTHGAVERDHDALFGKKAMEMHSLLNKRYNDGVKYKLHYVTARQAYNICRAAENGMTGDPSLYKDYEIAPYPANYYYTNKLHRLNACSSGQIDITFMDANAGAEVFFNLNPVKSLHGIYSRICIDMANKSLSIKNGNGTIQIVTDLKCCLSSDDSLQINSSISNSTRIHTLDLAGHSAEISFRLVDKNGNNECTP